MSQETRQRVEEALLRNHYVKEKKNNSGEPQHHLIAVYICLGKKKHVLTDPFVGVCWRGLTGNCENTIALWSAER